MPSLASANADTTGPEIEHTRIERAEVERAIVVRAAIRDASGVFAPMLFLRGASDARFDSLPMQRVGDVYEATIPKERVVPGLEYFVEAFDGEGNGPSRVGSPQDPIAIEVVDAIPALPSEPSAEPPKYPVAVATPAKDADLRKDDTILSAWWFWTIVGVAASAAVASGVLLATQRGDPVDFVDATIKGPDPAAHF